MVLAKLGPCGGHGGIYQDLHPEGVIRISKVIIHHGRGIFGINICFERENGEKVWTRRHGGIGTAFSEFFLGKNENITGITGTCGMIDNDRVITSISFHTDTGKIFGPFGYEEGFQWQLRAPGGKIVGFFVNSGSKLDSIGIHAYYNESPNFNSASVSKLGPCGGLGGRFHDLCPNGVSRVNKVIVHHGDAIFGINVHLQLDNGEKVWTGRKGGTGIMSNEIVLGKDENIIGVSGTTGLKDNCRVVRSIAFHTDQGKFFGPYGNEEISEWQLYAPAGGKIVGFFVRTGGLLDSVGIYVRSIFVPPVICRRVNLFGDEALTKEKMNKALEAQYGTEDRLCTIINVARDEDLERQIGREIYFDLVDHDRVSSFLVQKQLSFSAFKMEVSKEFGIPVGFQRYWLWAKKQNHTYRPCRPLSPLEETQTVGHLIKVPNKAHYPVLKLFLEIELGVDLRPIAPPEKTSNEIMIFFKLYDPEKQELRYVGRLFLKATGKPAEIITKLNEMAGFPPEEEIELYEEIKFEPNIMCEPIDMNLSFLGNQLEDGDIICFQKPATSEGENPFLYPDVPSFLENIRNRQVVHFRLLEKPKEEDFTLELLKVNTYDDVIDAVAKKINLEDRTKIRLTSHDCYSQRPKPQPIRYGGVEQLADMLMHYNQTSDILYYEVLDIPLPQLQGLKTLKVAFQHSTNEEVMIHSIRLPKNSTVGDVLSDLETKVELSRPDAELRLLEVFYHKIYKIFLPADRIENINEQYWTLRVEEIPEEEANLGPNDRLIHVYHFMKDHNQNENFGEPFLLAIREGETLGEVKIRIQKKLQVTDEEFAKWKFAVLSLGRPDYLEDTDIVSSRFQRNNVYGAWEQYLGLEHAETTPKRA